MAVPARAAAVLVMVASPVALACARPARVESGPPAGQERTVTGTVRQAGAAPFARTLIEGEDTIGVTGEREPELTRLTGARVRAVGAVVPGPGPGPWLRVESYEVLDVDGERPEVGWLRRDADGFRLEREDADPLRLSAVSRGLAAAAGGKVWVVVDPRGGVLRYGILIEP